MRVAYSGTIDAILRTSHFLEGYFHRVYEPGKPSRVVHEIRVKDNSQPIDKRTVARRFFKWHNGVYCRRASYGHFEYRPPNYVYVVDYYYWRPTDQFGN